MNWRYFICVACMIASPTHCFSGGAPTDIDPPAGKVVIRSQDTSKSISHIPRTNFAVSSDKKTYAQHTFAGERIVSTGLRMRMEIIAHIKEQEEEKIALLFPDMRAYEVEKILHRPDRIKNIMHAQGKREIWEYYEFGNCTTLRIFIAKNRLRRIERIR